MRVYHFRLQLLSVGLVLCPGYFFANAQNCPPNIDFETGTFNGWTCYIGSSAAVNGQNVIYLTPSQGPVRGRQTMYARNSGAGVDEYGGFPVNCPNGSGHSIRLGNNFAGTEAEGYLMSLPFLPIKIFTPLFTIMQWYSRIPITRNINNQDW